MAKAVITELIQASNDGGSSHKTGGHSDYYVHENGKQLAWAINDAEGFKMLEVIPLSDSTAKNKQGNSHCNRLQEEVVE